MILTVLGCYGPYPAAGQACSGYLLQNGNSAVLLDCGNGVFSRLRYYIEPWNLDAVILSHLHSDHISDLMIMRYAMMVRRKSEQGPPLSVFAPAEPRELFQQLSYKDYMQANAVSENITLNFGDMKIAFKTGVHAFPSFIIRVECRRKSIVYSGDTEYFPGLADAARNTDIFLCEANYLKADIEAGNQNHLAAFQAAAAAKEGGVGRLVLTHHHPERDTVLALKEAKAVFPQVETARAGTILRL